MPVHGPPGNVHGNVDVDPSQLGAGLPMQAIAEFLQSKGVPPSNENIQRLQEALFDNPAMMRDIMSFAGAASPSPSPQDAAPSIPDGSTANPIDDIISQALAEVPQVQQGPPIATHQDAGNNEQQLAAQLANETAAVGGQLPQQVDSQPISGAPLVAIPAAAAATRVGSNAVTVPRVRPSIDATAVDVNTDLALRNADRPISPDEVLTNAPETRAITQGQPQVTDQRTLQPTQAREAELDKVLGDSQGQTVGDPAADPISTLDDVKGKPSGVPDNAKNVDGMWIWESDAKGNTVTVNTILESGGDTQTFTLDRSTNELFDSNGKAVSRLDSGFTKLFSALRKIF